MKGVMAVLNHINTDFTWPSFKLKVLGERKREKGTDKDKRETN